jgi:flagellar protein FliL
MAAAKPGSEKSKSGLIGFIAITLGLAALGGGGGYWLVGHAMEQARAEAKAEQETAEDKIKADYTGTHKALALAPVISNLATPETWVRLEAAILYDESEGKLDPALPAQITEDVLALMRTLTIGHVSGASGFIHLKEDINERAALRSGGRVRDVLIQTLVFE